MKTTRYTIEQFTEEAKRFAHTLAPDEEYATVRALHGDLGAGKTTFTQVLARTLGVEEAVVSPTFVIQKIYALEGQLFERFIHIDAYRLERADEMVFLGWEELCADPRNLIVIEWPENVGNAIPNDARHIHFSYIDDETRGIAYE